MTDARPLFALLHLSDSLFPTGAFAHSDGLEAAIDAGVVRTPDDLGEWMDVCLDQSIARCDAPAVRVAWHSLAVRDWTAIGAINAEIYAIRPSAAARRATRTMGARLVKTWHVVHPHPDLQALIEAVDVDLVMTLPTAFGVVCASSGIPARQAIVGYIYTRLAGIASAAMRLMPIGQHHAHRLLAARLARAQNLVDAIAAGGGRPSACTPALDIAAMSHQYVHSRLFRS